MASSDEFMTRNTLTERARMYDADIRAKARAREARIRTLVRYARSKGLDANPDMVNKHLDWFNRWYAGALATGYLMNRTGVKFIVRDGTDDKAK